MRLERLWRISYLKTLRGEKKRIDERHGLIQNFIGNINVWDSVLK